MFIDKSEKTSLSSFSDLPLEPKVDLPRSSQLIRTNKDPRLMRQNGISEIYKPSSYKGVDAVQRQLLRVPDDKPQKLQTLDQIHLHSATMNWNYLGQKAREGPHPFQNPKVPPPTKSKASVDQKDYKREFILPFSLTENNLESGISKGTMPLSKEDLSGRMIRQANGGLSSESSSQISALPEFYIKSMTNNEPSFSGSPLSAINRQDGNELNSIDTNVDIFGILSGNSAFMQYCQQRRALGSASNRQSGYPASQQSVHPFRLALSHKSSNAAQDTAQGNASQKQNLLSAKFLHQNSSSPTCSPIDLPSPSTFWTDKKSNE